MQCNWDYFILPFVPQFPAIFHDYFTDNSSIHDHYTRTKNNLHVGLFFIFLYSLRIWQKSANIQSKPAVE